MNYMENKMETQCVYDGTLNLKKRMIKSSLIRFKNRWNFKVKSKTYQL